MSRKTNRFYWNIAPYRQGVGSHASFLCKGTTSLAPTSSAMRSLGRSPNGCARSGARLLAECPELADELDLQSHLHGDVLGILPQLATGAEKHLSIANCNFGK
jgi:hypothetical protein